MAAPHGDTPLRDLAWVAVDLEMTGLDPATERICEVGVAGSPLDADGAWGRLVSPGVPMTPRAEAVHGLGDDAVADAPAFEAVAADVAARIEGTLCFAHHAVHDRRFLDDAFARAGRPAPDATWCDTLALARRMLVLPSHRLSELCEVLGVAVDPTHRALADARAALGVGRALLNLLDPDGTLTVAGLEAAMAQLARRSDNRRDLKALLRGALADRRAVRFGYLSRDDTGRFRRTERELDVWKVSWPRVEGFCHLRREVRVFRAERMRDVVVVDRTYEVPSHDARI